MRKNKLLQLSFLVLTILFTTLFSAEQIVEVSPQERTNGVIQSGKFKTALLVKINSPWHIYSNTPLDKYTIKTEVKIDSSNNFEVNKITYPEDQVVFNEALDEKQAIYKDEIVILIQGVVSKNISKDTLKVKGSLKYQGCNDATCLPPQEAQFQSIFPVLEDSAEVQQLNQNYFEKYSDTSSISGSIDNTDSSEERMQIRKSIQQKGFLLTYLLIFVGGLGLILTPCIYPLIPITVSFFGGQAEENKGKSLLMAVLYVLGLALTNSVLGTVAALTGGLVGGILSNPWVLIGLAIILVALSLSMFGIYEFSLPSQLNQIGTNKKGYLGSFLTGLSLGIVAAPCIGPFIIGLLTYVASIGDPIIGFTMFFTLSVGMGAPFLFLAYFSNKLDQLPNSGKWMVGVRRIFGFVLIGMAIYFLRPLIGKTVYNYVLPLFLLGSGLFLLFKHFTDEQAHIFKIIKTIIAAGAIFGAGVFLNPAEKKTNSTLKWQDYSTSVYQKAVENKKPIIMDFSADWCVKCQELEKTTFTDSRVKELGQKFNLIKVDLTKRSSPRVQKLRKQFDIKGLPTIVFINQKGKELKNKRIIGYLKAKEFSERMQSVLNKKGK